MILIKIDARTHTQAFLKNLNIMDARTFTAVVNRCPLL